MPEKLTVLIPCKNESLNIRRCIESVRQVADEVLVADSHSTDDTLDIVRGLGGCRIIQREFINFANFKNWAIEQAAHPWVLVVDADERVTSELAIEIKQLLACGVPDHHDGFVVPRRFFFMGHPIRFSGCQNDQLLRLFRRDRCRYEMCRVHEDIFLDRRRVGRLKHTLLHYSYWNYDDFFAKHVRYTRWAAEDLWDKGHRAGFLNLFFRPLLRLFQLYVLRLGFLDGLAGLQWCMLVSFFNSFVKQARLWEMEHARPRPTDDLPVASASPQIPPTESSAKLAG